MFALDVYDDGTGFGPRLYAGGCGSFVLGDLTGDGVVGIDDIIVLFENRDFLILLANWGP